MWQLWTLFKIGCSTFCFALQTKSFLTVFGRKLQFFEVKTAADDFGS
jgi:hypothetical protein